MQNDNLVSLAGLSVAVQEIRHLGS